MRNTQKGSITIEATMYIPMAMFLVLITIRGGIDFYQQSVQREVYSGITTMDVVSEFYTYQMIKEVGEEWTDD